MSEGCTSVVGAHDDGKVLATGKVVEGVAKVGGPLAALDRHRRIARHRELEFTHFERIVYGVQSRAAKEGL